MRKQTIDPNQILNAAVQLAAREGLEHVSTRKIARECGISEGSIFHYYESKTLLLTQCFLRADREIDERLKTVEVRWYSLKRNIRELWLVYFDYFVTHGETARFYRQFRHSSYYTHQVRLQQAQAFEFFTQFVRNNHSAIQTRIDLFWEFIIENTLHFAVLSAEGQFPDTPEDRERYFSLIIRGIGGSLLPDKRRKE